MVKIADYGWLFLIPFILFSNKLVAQSGQIVVRGNVEKDPNTLVELRVYEDFITPVTTTVGYDRTNENGDFEITFKAIKQTRYQIVVQKRSKTIHLTPGYTYELVISPAKKLKINIESKDPSNQLLSKIQFQVLEYWSTHGNKKYDISTLNKINEVNIDLIALLDNTNANDYVREYLKYEVGWMLFRYYRNMRDTIALEGLEARLFTNAPVLFNNPKYFDLLGNYYFWTFNAADLGHVRQTSWTDPFQIYLEELSFIENDTVHQIAMLTACDRAYNGPWGPETRIITQFVDSIKEAALHEKIVGIAGNLVKKYSVDMIGTRVNDFTLYQSPTQTVQLSDYYGKYLLLDFWFVGCAWCIEAMPGKKKLRDQLADKFEILSIDPVDDFDRMQKWVDRHPEYDWPFLNAYQNRQLVDYFRISGYPKYLVLDPEGKVVLSPREFDFEEIYKDIKDLVK